MLGLDPERVIQRIRTAGKPVVLPDVRQSTTVGALGFGVVALIVFGLWALAGGWLIPKLGDKFFYPILAVTFAAGGPAAFKPVLIGENLLRFYVLFLGSFLVYAAIWMLCWFRWQHPGEWVASGLGPVAMGLIFIFAFRAGPRLGPSLAALIIGHTAGYFSGSWLFSWAPLHNPFGMEVWGLTYGVGFGAGIGYALAECQRVTRNRLLALRNRPADDVGSPAGKPSA